MWRRSAKLSFSANKLDVIHMCKLCEPCVFGLLKVEIWSYIAKTPSTQAVDWSCMVEICSWKAEKESWMVIISSNRTKV